jgi:transposase-like protein
MTEYSEAFKANMVKKLLVAGGPTASALSIRTGIRQPTLSRWLRDAKEEGMSQSKSAPRVPRRPAEWKPEEKLLLVVQAEGLTGDALGEFFRREGVHESDLAEWRGAALIGLGTRSKAPAVSGEGRRVRELERELLRKDKALAETAALLVLKKKSRTTGRTRTTARRRRPTSNRGAGCGGRRRGGSPRQGVRDPPPLRPHAHAVVCRGRGQGRACPGGRLAGAQAHGGGEGRDRHARHVGRVLRPVAASDRPVARGPGGLRTPSGGRSSRRCSRATTTWSRST